MTRGYLLIISIFLLLVLGTALIAQNDSITNNSYYFNDGGISNAKNLLKINFASLVAGDLPVNYERVLNNSFAMELGVGILLPYYGYEILWDDTVVSNPESGYSLMFHPKFYFFRTAPEGAYMGFQWRQRNYWQNNQHIVFTDYIFDYGLQLLFAKRMVLDLNFGVGLRTLNEKTINVNSGISGVVMPGSIKLGFIF